MQLALAIFARLLDTGHIRHLGVSMTFVDTRLRTVDLRRIAFLVIFGFVAALIMLGSGLSSPSTAQALNQQCPTSGKVDCDQEECVECPDPCLDRGECDQQQPPAEPTPPPAEPTPPPANPAPSPTKPDPFTAVEAVAAPPASGGGPVAVAAEAEAPSGDLPFTGSSQINIALLGVGLLLTGLLMHGGASRTMRRLRYSLKR